MPPTEPYEPPAGDVAPFPNEILQLSGGRYLTPSGEVLAQDDKPLKCGNPTGLKENTRKYWEGRAAVAGYTLDELLA